MQAKLSIISRQQRFQQVTGWQGARHCGLRILIVMLVSVTLLTGCKAISDVEAPGMTPTVQAMKGYELYSWQVDETWHFALVMGTNRLKTMDEITAHDVAIESVDELRSHLSQLAQGEEIIWTTQFDEQLSLPPESVIEEVKKVCQDLELVLTITSQ